MVYSFTNFQSDSTKSFDVDKRKSTLDFRPYVLSLFFTDSQQPTKKTSHTTRYCQTPVSSIH